MRGNQISYRFAFVSLSFKEYLKLFFVNNNITKEDKIIINIAGNKKKLGR